MLQPAGQPRAGKITPERPPAAGGPGSFHVAFTDSVLKEISLNGWIDPNLGRSASLSEGLPAAFSDKDRRLRGKVGLPLKSKMASILHLPLLRMALKGFLVFPE